MPFAKIDREGRFRVKPLKLTLKQNAETGSVNVYVLNQIIEMWNPGTKVWDDWTQYQPYEVGHNINLVKKTGDINARSVEDTIRCLGWSGDLEDFQKENYVPNAYQLDVKSDDYKGAQTFKGNWMYPWDADPNRSGVDETTLASLNDRFGPGFRAIASNAKSAVARPAGAPPAPPPAAPPPAAPVAATVPPIDDIPF